jgi:hypothetical protein
MPAPTYINIEYFFNKTFLYLRGAYFFTINLPWKDIVPWARTISAIIVVLFAIGIIYNIIGIHRTKRKKGEEEF